MCEALHLYLHQLDALVGFFFDGWLNYLEASKNEIVAQSVRLALLSSADYYGETANTVFVVLPNFPSLVLEAFRD